MDGFELVIFFFIYFLLCYWASSVAKSQGRDSVGYFFMAFLFSPILMLIILFVVGGSKSEKQTNNRVEDYLEKKQNIKKENNDGFNKYDQLEKLGALLKQGVLSEDEFKFEKEKILSHREEQKEVIIAKNEIIEEINYLSDLQKLIDKSSDGLFSSINEELIKHLNKKCTSKKNTEELMEIYLYEYKKDLTESLKNISSNYNDKRKYLENFIKFGIVDPKYPHQLR